MSAKRKVFPDSNILTYVPEPMKWWTEDLRDGQKIESVLVHNPLRNHF